MSPCWINYYYTKEHIPALAMRVATIGLIPNTKGKGLKYE